jgi:hypothetical protein
MEYTVKVDRDGTVRYYKPGSNLLHREDGPALVRPYGYKAWFREGKRHRENGPAQIFPYGTDRWFINDLLHREDGPAISMTNGYKAWYRRGLHHREDGPAIEHADGSKEWWIDGKRLSEEEFKNRTKEAKVRTFTVPKGTKEISICIE